jgi:hypothetical protein
MVGRLFSPNSPKRFFERTPLMKNWQHIIVSWLFLAAVIFPLIGDSSLFAQNEPPPSTAQENTAGRGGILINADGVMTRYSVMDVGVVTDQQLRIAKAAYKLSHDISAKSPMRCISLNNLEKTIIAAGGKITEEMLYLAGIQRITHVFYFPESKDIVIAGPAEGWFPGHEGAMIGVSTLQPVCELQHLITALRAYAPNRGEWDGIVGCSIDPTQGGIAGLQRFWAEARGLNVQQIVRGVRESLGTQVISVDGIPATTHAAQLMVAADYRMKRIGLGEDTLRRVPRLQTFINNTVPNASNALFRWYFVPDYESVILTEDRTGMQLVGDGVKLVAENEIVNEAGERTVQAGTLDRGSKAYTESFTREYPQIAKESLVFAQLRNWIDMLICAAHIQREDYYTKSGWSMEFFGNEEKYPLEKFVAPKTVEPVVGQRLVNRQWLTPVGGGIVIDAERALEEGNAKTDKDGRIATTQKKIALDLPEGVWWWDVK